MAAARVAAVLDTYAQIVGSDYATGIALHNGADQLRRTFLIWLESFSQLVEFDFDAGHYVLGGAPCRRLPHMTGAAAAFPIWQAVASTAGRMAGGRLLTRGA